MQRSRYVLSRLLAFCFACTISCGLGTSPSQPANGLGTSPSDPVGVMLPGELDLGVRSAHADVTPDVGSTGKPAEPIPAPALLEHKPLAPTTPDWLAMSAGWILVGLAALRKMKPKLFESDGFGFLLSIVFSAGYTVIEGLSRSEGVSFGTVKAALIMAVLASGGYSVLWKRGIKLVLLWALGKAAKRWEWAAKIATGLGTSPSKPGV
jgi:hypothetical protein